MMSAGHRFLRCILVVLLACWMLSAAAARQSPGPTAIPALIDGLRDPDPAIRARSAEALRGLGAAARPALVAASRSEDLSLAWVAGELLVSMPWHRPEDPQPVRTALLQYGQPDVAGRIEAVGRIEAHYPRTVANQVLPRLLMEEPNEDVCWHIVAALRRTMDADMRRTLRAIDPTGNRASALTVVARAWLETNRQTAEQLLRRAIEIEAQAPSYDDGELDFAFDLLAAVEESARRFDAAAALRRQQSSRVGLQRDAYGAPVFELFALHARHGPLEGFVQDVQTYTVYLGRPQVLYALSRMYQRGGDGLCASACARAAAVASVRGPQRLRVARFLLRHDWDDLAERELLAVVSTAPLTGEAAVDQVNARLRLASIARQREDDRVAAAHLRAALRLIEGNQLSLVRGIGERDAGQGVPFEPAELRGEIAWHEFRLARQSGNAAAAERHLGELLLFKPSTSRVIIDVVPYLKQRGQEAEAQTLFSAAYAVHRQRLDAVPDDPGLMNELAWLCARSGERLEEALELAMRAVNLSPGDAAHLDTAAEANFQVGRIDEAIRLEKAALELQPGYAFFREQLERFERARDAAAKPPRD